MTYPKLRNLIQLYHHLIGRKLEMKDRSCIIRSLVILPVRYPNKPALAKLILVAEMDNDCILENMGLLKADLDVYIVATTVDTGELCTCLLSNYLQSAIHR